MPRVMVLSLVLVGVLGCSSGGDTAREQEPMSGEQQAPMVSTRKLSRSDVMNGLERAGLTITPLDKTLVYPSDLQKFPAEPEAMFSIRLADGEGNSETMTLLQFASAGQVAGTKGVNGFPVDNWFFLGTISTFFRDKVVSALQ